MFASNQAHMTRSKYKAAAHAVALTVYCNDEFCITCMFVSSSSLQVDKSCRDAKTFKRMSCEQTYEVVFQL